MHDTSRGTVKWQWARPLGKLRKPLESYVTHFELLAELQKWKRTEGDPAREVDERPHYFALRLQKSAIEFYRTLPQATKKYDECVKAS